MRLFERIQTHEPHPKRQSSTIQKGVSDIELIVVALLKRGRGGREQKERIINLVFLPPSPPFVRPHVQPWLSSLTFPFWWQLGLAQYVCYVNNETTLTVSNFSPVPRAPPSPTPAWIIHNAPESQLHLAYKTIPLVTPHSTRMTEPSSQPCLANCSMCIFYQQRFIGQHYQGASCRTIHTFQEAEQHDHRSLSIRSSGSPPAVAGFVFKGFAST